MIYTTFERKNRADGQSERLGTTFERGFFISRYAAVNQEKTLYKTATHAPTVKAKCACITKCRACACSLIPAAQRLLVRPLQRNLLGLVTKLLRLDDNKVNQAIIDSAMFLLIELPRIDQQEVGL